MKNIFFIVLISTVINPAFSFDYNSEDSNADQSEYKYESSSGTKYKYDLNNPADRVLYDVDPAAKILDDINPKVRIDRNLNQYGGGADW